MDDHEVTVDTITSATKETITGDEAVPLALNALTILAAKGKKIVRFTVKHGNLADDATEDDLRKAIVGPSGKLRAPTLWSGSTLLVGYHPDMYAEALLD